MLYWVAPQLQWVIHAMFEELYDRVTVPFFGQNIDRLFDHCIFRCRPRAMGLIARRHVPLRGQIDCNSNHFATQNGNSDVNGLE